MHELTADETLGAHAAPLAIERPRLRQGVTSHPYAEKRGGSASYVVRGQDSGKYILTSTLGVKIIECLDGERRLEDIARELKTRWGADVPREKIKSFLDICSANDLLVEGTWASAGTPTVPPELKRERLGLYSNVYNADEYLDFILEYRKFWLNPFTKALAAVLFMLGVYNLFVIPEGGGVIAPLKQLDMSYTDVFLLVLPLVFVVEVALHELGHALSCRLMGARPKGFGFGLLWGVIPIVFTDTTDAYTIPSKAKRMFVSFAGPMVDVMFFGVTMTLYWLSDPDSLAAKMLLAYSAFPLTSIIVSLNPFYLRMDGYWILADYVGKPNLRRSSMRYLKSLFRRKAEARDALASHDPRERALFAGYIIVALAWTIGYVGYVLVESLITVVALMDGFFNNSIYM